MGRYEIREDSADESRSRRRVTLQKAQFIQITDEHRRHDHGQNRGLIVSLIGHFVSPLP